ncbi:MAG: M24 family metallopeptidase, partial [Candidatus Ranarchaeia archaeon]
EWLQNSGEQMCKDIKRLSGKDDAVIGVLSTLSLGDYDTLRGWLKKHLPKTKIFKHPRKIDGIFSELRKIKTPKEIKFLKQSCSIASDTVPMIGDFIVNNPGLKERDLAVFIDTSMMSRGGEGSAFETIVASSKRSWQIHTYPRASKEILTHPGLGLTDFGTKLGGFCSDVTVPFTFGKLTREQELIRDTVIEASQAAIDRIEIGTPIWEVSKAATDIIEEAGYKLPHGLGHGIGLEIHDPPHIVGKPQDPAILKKWKPELIEQNMVFTIEPGIYSSKHGGFRFENDVLVNRTKPELLTQSEVLCFPKI